VLFDINPIHQWRFFQQLIGHWTADPCLVLSVLAVEGAGEVGLDDTLALPAHCRVILPIDKYYFPFLMVKKSCIFTSATWNVWNVSKNRVVC
jgi:hypothetical protein